jgi:hypothetical protein
LPGDLLADAFVGAGDQCGGSVHGVDDAAGGPADPGITRTWEWR